MNGELIALILDIVVLGFLLATIFYVIRLSKGLSDFKAHRREFDGVITSLLSSIDKAEKSVHSLKQISVQEAGDLERLIKQSRAMSEELQIINEAGESMAKRLEKLAEKNRKIAQKSHFSMDMVDDGDNKRMKTRINKKDYKSTLKTVEKNDDKEAELPSFMIQDREFTDANSLENHLGSSASNDVQDAYIDDDIPENLQSQAEKELFAALRTNKGRV